MKFKKIVFIIITIAWVAVIFSFSLQSGDVSGNLSESLLVKISKFFIPSISANPAQLEVWHFLFRKCAHFGEYFILGTLGMITLLQMNLHYRSVFSIGFCVLIASLDETLQLFVAGRAGSLRDVFIDSAGAAAGIIAVVFCVWFINRKKIRK